MNKFLDNYFKLSENGTNTKQEFIAGITTFMTMAYILIVNPSILSAAGMDAGAIFTATALSSIIATLVMGLYAKLPFAFIYGIFLSICINSGIIRRINIFNINGFQYKRSNS